MTALRQIEDHMLTRMKQAAAEVWKEHERDVDSEVREEWRKLCWRHVCNHFGKLERPD